VQKAEASWLTKQFFLCGWVKSKSYHNTKRSLLKLLIDEVRLQTRMFSFKPTKKGMQGKKRNAIRRRIEI
jgi:hypothetical protein